MNENINKLREEVWLELEKIADLEALEKFRVKYLGKRCHHSPAPFHGVSPKRRKTVVWQGCKRAVD